MINFDVLIVYTEALASSASDATCGSSPFLSGSKNESYNTVYGYFLDYCHRVGLNVAFTTSADIVGAGVCRSFWTRESKRWVKTDSACYSKLIFDKFSPTRNRIKVRRKLLFSSSDISSFNDPELFGLFFDKQKTHDKLSRFTIPTVSIEGANEEGVVLAMDRLKELVASHPGFTDFGEDLIMKDRYGAGGRHIYKFKSDQLAKMKKIVRKYSKISFVIQPFALFDQGFSYNNNFASTDVRLIYLNGSIAQSYIRVAKKGDFRCNEHQGGSLIYLPVGKIPKEITDFSKMISENLNKQKSLYALDFIVSNNGNIYLLEGNTGPGLDWNLTLKKNEIEAKKLIRLVAKELSERAGNLIILPKVTSREKSGVSALVYSATI